MSGILYYSNNCVHCKNLLNQLSRSNVKNDLHFLCIDRRVKKEDGYYIQLENGQEILLPQAITSVPSLLLINRGNMILVGNDVNNYINEKHAELNVKATNNNGEPEAFGINQFGSFHNDSYSFIDQSADELSAKGNGGIRQTHNYATLDYIDKIETPPDNYVPERKKNMTMEELQKQRESDVPKPQQKIG